MGIQIHELTTYSGTPTSSDYLVIDDGAETTKVNAKGLGYVDIDTGNINLDTTAQSGDDYNLTQKLTQIGWVSAVAVGGKALMKKWLYRITDALDTINAYDIKSKITPATGVTINSAYLYVFSGRVAQLYIVVTFASGQTADASYEIGTLAEALKPRNLAPLTSTYGGGQMNVGGGMSFRPQVNLNGGSQRSFSSTYLLMSRYTG